MRIFRGFLLPASVCLAIFPSLLLPAQTKPAAKDPSAGRVSGKGSYDGESFVINRTDWVYSENADGTGWREHTVEVKLQSEASLRQFGVLEVPFASASEHVEFKYIRVRHADGTLTDTPASEAIEQPEKVTRDAPFYSDLKQDQVPVKNLRVGDTLEWQARIVRTRAEAPNEFWGVENFVTPDAVALEETIELRAPATKTVNAWTNLKLSAPEVTTEGGEKVWRWKSSQLKPTTGPEAAAAKKAKEGKVLTADEELDEEQGQLPSVAWTTFKTWEDVGAWYRKLEGERAVPDDELKAKVAEITASSKTEEDKVRAVYAYVSSQVRYIGVAFGVGRFQPHEAADVLHNQYGDCKDKATLLSSMLEVLGLNPDSVLIGADIRMNEAVPSPASFNHLINRVKVGNEEVWLDSTQEVAPYRVLLFPLRDKQALVIPDSGPAQLLRTPKDLPFPSLETWSSVGSLNSDGVSESHIKLTLRGDDEIVLRSVVHEIAPAQYDEFGQRMMNGMGYSGTTSHASFSRPEDTSAPFTFDVDYHREKAGDWDNLKTIPQVAPIQLPTVDEKDPPTQSLNLGTPRTEASTSEMKLPQGWTAELPEAVHEKTPFASYDMTYRFENGTVYADRTLVILKQRVPAADWREYKKWTDAIGLGYDKYIQLYGKGGTAAAGGAEGHVTNPEAETLISQAYDAENKSHDSKTAEALLKRARDLDPQAKGLWSASGWVARQKGKLNEAVQDYRKELGLYPREFEVYNYLNSAYISNRDRPGAEQACREWIAANPKDARPEQYLAFDLLEDNKPAESEEEAKKAVALTPNDDVTDKELRTVVLGRAQLKAQQTSQGEATLLGILKTTIDPGTLNDAAYELANLNLDLPLAEKDIHEALTKLEEESESWTLDEAPDKLAKKSRLLIATWDSYGWVLFREGKVADAQTWVEAAWTNSQSAEEKEHVETIRTALHQSPMDEGKKAGRTARTIQLRSFSGGKATGEYRLLLQHGKVLRATATGKAVDGADELLKQASFARLFPAGSDAKLVRTGMLNCFSGKCELVLEP